MQLTTISDLTDLSAPASNSKSRGVKVTSFSLVAIDAGVEDVGSMVWIGRVTELFVLLKYVARAGRSDVVCLGKGWKQKRKGMSTLRDESTCECVVAINNKVCVIAGR